MSDNVSKNDENPKGQHGIQDENSIPHIVDKLYDKLKKDLGIVGMALVFFGSILLIFSPEQGWGFDLPFLHYTLAYRGWFGISFYLIALFLAKTRKLYKPKYKSIYIHFPNDLINLLGPMTQELDKCNTYKSAYELLVSFQKIFKGEIFYSQFPQNFVNNKAIKARGIGKKKWKWWHWEGGEEGYQLVVSLCQ